MTFIQNLRSNRMFKLVVVIAVVAVIISLCFIPDTPISGKKIILGTPGYDISILAAPAARSTMLDVLSYILSRTRFSPVIRRKLLNDNNIANLRELAAQIEHAPMSFPMKRVDAQRYGELTSQEEIDQATQTLLQGFQVNYLPAFDREKNEPFYPRTITEYHAHYRSGKFLPSEVVLRSMETVKQWENEGFRIFSSILPEDVLQAARASDERWRNGAPLSVFDGVPVAFKDMMDVAGHIIYEGRNPNPAHQEEWVYAEKDDLMVTRLRDLGAIVFGVTIEVEGGVSPLGFNSHFQGPLSPYSKNRYSGGSSSGSAVAVATGIVPVAIGYDGGGSIRLPACMSGVHGLATTFGRIPFSNHTSTTMIKGGPLAASSQDAALTYAAIARNSPGSFYQTLYDGGMHGPPPPHLRQFDAIEDLSDVRIGIFPEWFADSDAHIQQRCREAVSYLRSRGATVVEITIPHLQIMSLAHAMKIATEFALGWDSHFHNHPTSMEPAGRIVVGLGSTITALETLAGDRVRAWAFDYMTELFQRESLTAIINPTMPIEVPELTEETKLRGESNTVLVMKMMKYIFIANLLGLPGYNVPVGYLPAANDPTLRLPVGLHLLGNHWEDHQLLRLAHSVEVGFTRTLPAEERPDPIFHHDPFTTAQ